MSGARAPFGSRVLGSAGQSGVQLRRRVQLLLTGQLVVVHITGAGIAFVVSFLLVPVSPAEPVMAVSTAVAVPVYAGTAMLLGVLLATSTVRRALRWAVDDVPPTAAQRARVLAIPFRMTILQLVPWCGAAALFTVLAALLQPERALPTGLTIGTATVVVCGIGYLLTEFTLRPVTARALASGELHGRPVGSGITTRMVVAWAVGTGVPVLVLLAGGVVALAGGTGPARLGASTVVVCSGVLVFGLAMTVMSARAVAAPVRDVRRGLRRVERGDLDGEVVVYDGSELGALQAGYNRMLAGMREQERLRDLLGRHVGEAVASHSTAAGSVALGGETRTVSVLFVDAVGSTRFAAERPAREVVEVVNRFFGIVVTECTRHGGLVNKFMGDAVLVVLGAPEHRADHASAALHVARRLARRLTTEIDELDVGIGVATGSVVVGYVGHESRYEYTAMGDAVNAAARLTDLAKAVPGRVLVDRATLDSAEPHLAERFVAGESVVLRGRTEPTPTARLAPEDV